MSRDVFDPDNISKEDMNRLADSIEDYLNFLEEIMVIPKEIIDECAEDIHEGIKRSKKLIKKLRNGDKSVFKDSDEWNSLL